MTAYGVTPSGFVIKPFLDILNEKLAQAQELFGPDVDLRSTSSLRKILDVASAEDGELWKALEGAFYSTTISTGSGAALDLLGDDLGLARDYQNATGGVSFTLAGAAPNRTYVLPVGTLVETDPPIKRFRTTETVTLSSSHASGTAGVRAVVNGPSGNLVASAIKRINAVYAAHYLSLGSATVSVTNASPFTGGDVLADDETYRKLLLAIPRTLWTVDAVRAAVLNVDGVRDCRLSDPLGGVDVSQSIFNLFVYDRRRFGQQRFLGSPYYFDVLVAPYPGFTWGSDGGVVGLSDAVTSALDGVRPIGIFPNVTLADAVVVGVRASILTKPGMDAEAVTAALKDAFGARVSGLGLGGDILASEVICDFMNVAGVTDVQQLHLRRYPPYFGQIKFGDRENFLSDVIEADIGANLPLSPNEIATYRFDSQLIDLQVSDR